MLFILFFFTFSWANTPPDSEVTETTSNSEIYSSVFPENICSKPGATVAINRDMTIAGHRYSAGTEIYFDAEGNALAFTQDKNEVPIELKRTISDFSCNDVTVIPVDPITGELGEYSLPIDFKLAGKGKARKRKGVTNCYRAVKALVKNQIVLTGLSAYMAAPQLQKAGFKMYKFKDAPNGSICVFGPGGKKTASGGHIHGHIGIKGMTGLVNPNAGFALGRPFIGCFAKR
jgi:hypothetical protein